MTIPFALIFGSLLADLAARNAAGRLDGDDLCATAVLTALDRAIRTDRAELEGLARACVTYHRPESAPTPPHVLGARGPGAIVTDDDGDID